MPKPHEADIAFETRIWEKFDFFTHPDGCWEWPGTRQAEGYGTISIQGQRRAAHRLFYEYFVGPIPDGLVIDHLCRNRACVNPKHLEAVTTRENNVRGIGFIARHAATTHCPQGHEYTPENTNKVGRDLKGRACKTCNRDRARERQRRIARAKVGSRLRTE